LDKALEAYEVAITTADDTFKFKQSLYQDYA